LLRKKPDGELEEAGAETGGIKKQSLIMKGAEKHLGKSSGQ